MKTTIATAALLAVFCVSAQAQTSQPSPSSSQPATSSPDAQKPAASTQPESQIKDSSADPKRSTTDPGRTNTEGAPGSDATPGSAGQGTTSTGSR